MSRCAREGGFTLLEVLVAVAILMLGVALAACFVPARRAIGVEPAAVLRNE